CYLQICKETIGLNWNFETMSINTPLSFPDQIDRDLLYAWGAVSSQYEKGQIIFTEDEQARNFYQIENGAVRMFNLSKEGREYTQGMFYTGQSFGEPPLFIDGVYPAAA